MDKTIDWKIDVGRIVTIIGCDCTHNDTEVWFSKKSYKQSCDSLTEFIDSLLSLQKEHDARVAELKMIEIKEKLRKLKIKVVTECKTRPEDRGFISYRNTLEQVLTIIDSCDDIASSIREQE
jgi:uncharacterized protein Yka (UPF0111/DUF47 family)